MTYDFVQSWHFPVLQSFLNRNLALSVLFSHFLKSSIARNYNNTGEYSFRSERRWSTELSETLSKHDWSLWRGSGEPFAFSLLFSSFLERPPDKRKDILVRKKRSKKDSEQRLRTIRNWQRPNAWNVNLSSDWHFPWNWLMVKAYLQISAVDKMNIRVVCMVFINQLISWTILFIRQFLPKFCQTNLNWFVFVPFVIHIFLHSLASALHITFQVVQKC